MHKDFISMSGLQEKPYFPNERRFPKMKKVFEEPVLTVISFQTEDIVTNSNWGEEDWDELKEL